MASRLGSAILLAAAGALLQGCWIVIDESFDGYEPKPETAPGEPIIVTEERAWDGPPRRTYTLVRPNPTPADLQLVIELHGEAQSPTTIRNQLPIDAEAAGDAVFVYPQSASADSFNTYAGRTAEAAFVQQLIGQLSTELRIDTGRVFIAGFDDGAIMANALACNLGASVVRGVGIDAGTFYPAGDRPDFMVNDTTGVADCTLPAALLVWGVADPVPSLSIESGRDARNVYLATQGCDEASARPWTSDPACSAYAGCREDVVWCEIPGLGHDVWPGAARAMWTFFDGLKERP